jgi:hypothetical protein
MLYKIALYRETYIGTSKEQRTTTGHKEEVTKARLPLDKMGIEDNGLRMVYGRAAFGAGVTKSNRIFSLQKNYARILVPRITLSSSVQLSDGMNVPF